jgi:hypothetical protein
MKWVDIANTVSEKYPEYIGEKFGSGKMNTSNVQVQYARTMEKVKKVLESEYPEYVKQFKESMGLIDVKKAMEIGLDIDAGRWHRAVNLAKRMSRHAYDSDDFWDLSQRIYRQSLPKMQMPRVVEGEQFLAFNLNVPDVRNMVRDEVVKPETQFVAGERVSTLEAV